MSESSELLAKSNRNNGNNNFNESDIAETLTQQSFEIFLQEVDVKDESQFSDNFLDFLLKNNIITTKEGLSGNSVLGDIMDEKYFKQLQTTCKSKTGCKLWHPSEITEDTLTDPSTIDDLYSFLAFAPFIKEITKLIEKLKDFGGNIQLREFCKKLKDILVSLGRIKDQTYYIMDVGENQKAADFKALLSEKQFYVMMKALTEVYGDDLDVAWLNGKKYRGAKPITFPLIYDAVSACLFNAYCNSFFDLEIEQ